MLGCSGRCTTWWWRPLVATPGADRRVGGTSVDVVNEIEGIDRHRLERLVRASLGSDTAQLIDWHLAPIQTGADLGSSVSHIAGTARDHGRALAWSVILKVVRPTPDELGPSGWHYWQRESLAYTSGLLDDLPAGLTAPRCLAVENRGTDWSRMWLEDVADVQDGRWSRSTYSSVARQLGRFNGAYLTGERTAPCHAWLSRGWLRGWTEKSAPVIAQFPGILEHAPVRRFLRGGAAAYLRLWSERGHFLDVLDRLPRTFCHHDAFPRNIRIRRGASGQDQPVAIDWAFAGSGAVGEELVPLILASATFCEIEPSAMIDLEQAALAAYTEGLRDAGWRGEPQLVRLGYTIAAALRFGPGCAIPALPTVLREDAEEFVLAVFGVPLDEALDRWSAVTSHVLELADEARELMEGLPRAPHR